MNLDGRSTALLAVQDGPLLPRHRSRERIATGATPESAIERLATLISHDTNNSPRIIIATATDTDASCARTPKGT